MEKILKKIENASEDEEIIGAYDAEFHRNEIERLGKMYAKEEGILESKKEIALNLLKENIDLDIISRVTGLTQEEIKDLK